DQLLGGRGADPVDDPAVELALDDHRVEGTAAVVYRRVAQEPQRSRLDIDFERAGVRAERPRDGLRPEESAGVEPRRPLPKERRAPERYACQVPERDPAAGHADDVRAAGGEHDVRRRALEQLAGDEPR